MFLLFLLSGGFFIINGCWILSKAFSGSVEIIVLFLEELTNASEVMQSKAYGIALDKKVAGRWILPENARVVAA